MSIKIIFRWYNLWIGLYYDTKNDCIYICPFPCLVIKWQLIRRQPIYFIGDGIAFGAQSRYYKWVTPFFFDVYGNPIEFHYEAVTLEEYWENHERQFSIFQNLLFNVRAIWPNKFMRGLAFGIMAATVIIAGIYLGHLLNGWVWRMVQ